MLLYHFDNGYLIYQYRDIFVIPTTAIANVIEPMRLPIKSKISSSPPYTKIREDE